MRSAVSACGPRPARRAAVPERSASVSDLTRLGPETGSNDSKPHLLFICVENSCRSQMAESFARTLGANRVVAASAGSRPSGQVNARAVQFMAEKGIDLAIHASKGLDDIPATTTWDYVVTMGCGDACPFVPARHRLDWDLQDPKHLDDAEFRNVRDRIEAEVTALLAQALAPRSGETR
jgi:protein-tyrosine-phosphatase